jgi:hypothetical protein
MGKGVLNIAISLDGRAVVNISMDSDVFLKSLIEKGIPEDEAVNTVNILNKAFGGE